MGTIKKYNVATTGPNAALLRKVTRLDRRESAGMLFLGGPNHPAAPMAAGAPAPGAIMPNAAWATASAMIGGNPARATVDATFSAGASHTAAGAVKGKIERSAKGGLHILTSQAQVLANGDGASLFLNAALRSYLFANRTHNFYISHWDRSTRVAMPLGGTNVAIAEGGAGSSSPDYSLYMMGTGGQSLFATNLAVGLGIEGSTRFDDLANVRRHVAGSGKPAPVASSFAGFGPIWGMVGYNAAVLASTQNRLRSSIFYEMFIEDLTVSGRTYAQVDALDSAAWKEAFGVGGRYYGDTWSDPATLVP